jgi:site-specific DNA-methyltransferase (cytosine-N4-specific)
MDNFSTSLGRMLCGNALDLLPHFPSSIVDLVFTSPPYALVCPKAYGNPEAEAWLEMFRPFAAQIKRVLRPGGSLVVNLGGSWLPGRPERSLYQFELPIMLVREFGFHLCQEFFWFNPSRIPCSYWVNIDRSRMKDAVECLWWLSNKPKPTVDNRRLAVPYGKAQKRDIVKGRKKSISPSGHKIGHYMAKDNGGGIPPNLLAVPSAGDHAYIAACRRRGITPHPARFPLELPEYFQRFLTDPGDLVLDPFAGSCVTAEAAEKLGRRWLCIEQSEEYLEGGTLRFRENYKRAESRPGKYELLNPRWYWEGEG